MPADLFGSPDTIMTFVRQSAKDVIGSVYPYGYYATTLTANPGKQTTDRGILLGTGDPHQQPKIATGLMPEVDFTLQAAADAMNMQAKAASGNHMISEGTAHGTPAATTLSAAAARHARAIVVASIASYAPGDNIKINTMATPGTPIISDIAEVREVLNVGAHNATYLLVISATGGTFTLTYGGQTTSALAYNANAAAIQAALVALATIGAGGVTVATATLPTPPDAATPLPTTAFTITAAGSLVSTVMNPITCADALLTVVGTAYAFCTQTQIGGTATTITLVAGLLNAQPSGAAVSRLDKTLPIYHYAMHAGDSKPQCADYWTCLVSFQNSSEQVNGFYYNGRITNNSPSFQATNIPTKPVKFEASKYARNYGLVQQALATRIASTADYVISPVSGTITIGGVVADLDAPTSLGVQETTNIYKHQPIGNFFIAAMRQTGHALMATLQGVLSKAFYNKINFSNSDANVTVQPDVYNGSFSFVAKAGTLVRSSTTEYFAVEENWPDADMVGYNPSANGPDVVQASFDISATKQLSTSIKRFYTKYTTSLTADVYSSKI